MVLAASIIGIALAVVWMWLTVRIVNRRERWAKRMLAIMLGLPMVYVMSFGPACWIAAESYSSGPRRYALILYWPLGNLADNSNSLMAIALRHWITLGLPEGKHVVVPTGETTWTKFGQR